MPVRLNGPPLAILRPEPGNSATAARAVAAGFATVSLPLFEIAPLAWTPPDPGAFDALILTSANALRFGGPGLARLRALPVLAVGPHTADAARAAGFDVHSTGTLDAAAMVAEAHSHGIARALHLAGRERMLAVGGPVAAVIPVYASVARAIDPAEIVRLRSTIALLHSARAARQIAALVDRAGIARADLALAAFSPAIATAAGTGWAAITVAAHPDDAALFAAVDRLPSAASR